MDDEDGDGQMQQQLAQLLRLVDAPPHIVQVHRKGQDEADLGQLRGLQGEAAQLVPGVVVGVARIVANGQRADGHVPDEQRRQHQTPGQGHMHRPHFDEAAVVDVGQQQRHHDADEGRNALHQRAAVVADAGDLARDLIHGKSIALLRRPGRQRHTGHYAAENAQQQVHFIRSFKISLNALQRSTALSCSSRGSFFRCSPILVYYTAMRDSAQDGAYFSQIFRAAVTALQNPADRP